MLPARCKGYKSMLFEKSLCRGAAASTWSGACRDLGRPRTRGDPCAGRGLPPEPQPNPQAEAHSLHSMHALALIFSFLPILHSYAIQSPPIQFCHSLAISNK
jgi:hypothetical protein